MKNLKITAFLITICATFLLSATHPAQKNAIYGKWKMVSGKTNGMPNQEKYLDRTFLFNKDNTYEGKIFINDVPQPYGRGVFMVPNDTTLVTIATNPDESLSMLAFKYNFALKNDTLHRWGYYMVGSKDQQGILKPMYLDEKWVRIK